MTTRDLAVLLFADVEVLDFCGPFEVFAVANRFTDPPAFRVLTVAEKPGPVLTRGGLSANPRRRLADSPGPIFGGAGCGQFDRSFPTPPTVGLWAVPSAPRRRTTWGSRPPGLPRRRVRGR